MIDIVLIAKIISILATTAVILSGLWVLRNFRRYTCPVFITSATMIAAELMYLQHSFHHYMKESPLPIDALQLHMLMDISFIMMSIVLTKCAFKKAYLQQLCESNQKK